MKINVCNFQPIISGGESGSADTVRDPRGFAIKFYTEEGNWDLVGNNTPIFFIRDPLHVSDDDMHTIAHVHSVTILVSSIIHFTHCQIACRHRCVHVHGIV